MRYGLDIPITGEYASPSMLADLAVEAEEAEWEGFFLWDIVASGDEPVVDPWIALAAIAMRTERIRIGAFLTPLARRRPWLVARQAAAIDHLSGGRLIFGGALGQANQGFTAFHEELDPRVRSEMLDEGLAIVQGLWSGLRFSFTGKHYQLDDVLYLPKPVQVPRIPIWVAGGWPHRKPLRRAAQWDGIYLMTVNQETRELLSPQDVNEAAAYIAEHRQTSDPFDIGVNGVTPDDRAEAAEIVRPYCGTGATWWVEYAASRWPLVEYRKRILAGPPVVSL